MGQQQILLIALVTIVVGIASIVAIATFGTAAGQANRDALTIDVTTLAASAQEYYLKPGTLRGGGQMFDNFVIEGKILPVTGISSDGQFVETENGTLEVVSAAGGALTIIGHPSSCDGYISGVIDDNGVLTEPGTCSEFGQISATVRSREIVFE